MSSTLSSALPVTPIELLPGQSTIEGESTIVLSEFSTTKLSAPKGCFSAWTADIGVNGSDGVSSA